jgi:type II secretory pathway pseudopilin PulG
MTIRLSRQRLQHGMMLIDCIAYIGLLAIILTLAFLAFYRTTENSNKLSRNAADISLSLQAGERWREDVRSANGEPRLDNEAGVVLLRLPHASGEITYAFRDDTVLRRALPNTNWLVVLPALTASAMHAEPRRHATCWHWDVELKGRQKVARVRPLFSFEAVAGASNKP